MRAMPTRLHLPAMATVVALPLAGFLPPNIFGAGGGPEWETLNEKAVELYRARPIGPRSPHADPTALRTGGGAASGQCNEHGRIGSRLSAMSQHERDIVEARMYQHLPEPLLCCLFPCRKDTQF